MEFWDRIAGVYDFCEGFNSGVYNKMLYAVEKLTPDGATVLDCAAGTGALSIAAAKKADSVLCTDLSEKMLENARKKAASQGAVNIDFAERNIFHLPEEDETYDVVIAGNVLHLLKQPENAVKELWRVTKKGGKLLLPTFVLGRSCGDENETIKLLSLGMYKLFGFSPEMEYTPSQYRKMLEDCGLGTVRAKLIKGIIPCCFAVIYKD